MADWAGDDRFPQESSWRGRGFAFLRFVVFAVLFIAANLAMHPALAPIHKHIKSLEGHILIEMLALVPIVFLLTAIMARFSGRSFSSYGLGGTHKARNFVIGIVAGIAFLAVQLLVENRLGYFSFGSPRPVDGALMSHALLLGAMCLAIGFMEENLFRGYPLVEISRALSFWPAVAVMALLFGLPHWLKGEGENVIGGLQAGLFGVVFAFAFRATGSLWLVIGFHAAWDYAQSFIFGTPDSAMVSPLRWLHPAIHGPDWLSGGRVGPEGSIFMLIPLSLLAATIWLVSRNRVPVTPARVAGPD